MLMHIVWGFIAIFVALVLILTFLALQRSPCAVCYRGWALFTRRNMHVCRMCAKHLSAGKSPAFPGHAAAKKA